MKKKVLLTTAIAAVVYSVASYALPSRAYETSYYSDASMTHEVGNESYMCGSRIYFTGEKTQYKQKFDLGSCSRGW
jgi:hypothetical protein